MRVLALLVWAALAVSAALGDARLAGAGDGEHAWIAVEQAWRDDGGWQLYHVASDDEAGSLTRVMVLDERPLALVGEGERLVMIFPARSVPDGGSVRRVRSVRVDGRGAGGVYRFRPPGRGRAEAALSGSGVLIGAALTPDGPGALLRPTTTKGPGRLLVLDESEWNERPLPEGLDENAGWEFRNTVGGALVADARGSWVWDDSSGWRDAALPEMGEATLLTAGGRLVAARWSEDGGLALSLVQGGGEIPLTTLPSTPREQAVVGVGETVCVYWFDEDEPLRLRATVVSANTGEVLYEDFAGSPGPLEQQDLQFIALVAGSVLLIVILFLLRPEGDLQREPVLPEGAALAEAGARFLAAVIDALPAALVSALVWDVPLWAAVSPGLAIEEAAGLNPIFLTGLLYFVHSTLSEWLTGRTLGKSVTGCRTVDSTGAPRLRFKQALVRNLFKAVFPPLTMLLMLDPWRRHPADQVGGTLVVARARDKSPDEE